MSSIGRGTSAWLAWAKQLCRSGCIFDDGYTSAGVGVTEVLNAQLDMACNLTVRGLRGHVCTALLCIERSLYMSISGRIILNQVMAYVIGGEEVGGEYVPECACLLYTVLALNALKATASAGRNNRV
jgi:hypothetical protein